MHNRRSRERRGVFGSPPPSTDVVPRTHRETEYESSFNVPLHGEGTISLLDYSCHVSEYARIEFMCLVSGSLRVSVGGKVVLSSRTYAGRGIVEGLFFPAGSHVTVSFTNNFQGGTVSGKIRIGPAPQNDALAKARSLFGLTEKYAADDVRAAQRRLAIRFHPDRPGGSHAKMLEVNHASDMLLKALG